MDVCLLLIKYWNLRNASSITVNNDSVIKIVTIITPKKKRNKQFQTIAYKEQTWVQWLTIGCGNWKHLQFQFDARDSTGPRQRRISFRSSRIPRVRHLRLQGTKTFWLQIKTLSLYYYYFAIIKLVIFLSMSCLSSYNCSTVF